jgi:hypothetical protein
MKALSIVKKLAEPDGRARNEGNRNSLKALSPRLGRSSRRGKVVASWDLPRVIEQG